MSAKLLIHEEELGRFLLAYHRGVFPHSFKLGASFLLFYDLIHDPYYNGLKNEKDDEKAIEYIKEEFTGRLS